jgi:hypothetical protein
VLIGHDIKGNKSFEISKHKPRGPRVDMPDTYGMICLTHLRSWCRQRGRTLSFWLPHSLSSVGTTRQRHTSSKNVVCWGVHYRSVVLCPAVYSPSFTLLFFFSKTPTLHFLVLFNDAEQSCEVYNNIFETEKNKTGSVHIGVTLRCVRLTIFAVEK